MVIQIAVTVGAWLILMLVTTNLVGFLVRGLVANPEMERLATEGHDLIKKAALDYQGTQTRLNYVGVLLIVAFLSALYHFWNAGVIVAALMLMVVRVPNLLWELRNAGQLELKDRKRPPLWMLSALLSWLALPVLWYALYRM